MEIFILFLWGGGYRSFNGAASVSADLVSSDDLQTPALKPVTHFPVAGHRVVDYPHDVGLFG